MCTFLALVIVGLVIGYFSREVIPTWIGKMFNNFK